MSTEHAGLYGIHSVRILDHDDYSTLGNIKILGDFKASFEPETVELKGGSSLSAWQSVTKEFKCEVSITGREYTAAIVEQALNADVTEYDTNVSGQVISLENVHGTSAYNATTGISAITITDPDELKAGTYRVVVLDDGITVNVEAFSDASFTRPGTGNGTSVTYVDEKTGRINATPISITTGGSSAVTNFGFSLTGGTGTIGMTKDDALIFTVIEPGDKAFSAAIGKTPIDFPECAIEVTSETVDGIRNTLTLRRVKCSGMSLPFSEKAFAEYTIKITVLTDNDRNEIATFVRSFPA